MRCWICYEEDNLYKCCNCNNEYGVVHKKCILKLYLSNKKNVYFVKIIIRSIYFIKYYIK